MEFLERTRWFGSSWRWGWIALLYVVSAPAFAATNETPMLVVMTYNIHHGEGLDGRVDLERIAEVVRGQKADVVALQEVDRHVARSGRWDFPAELERLTGMSCVFSNNYSFQGGEYGNAVLTRFPVLSGSNVLFQSFEVEPRGMLHLVLNVRGREVVLMATHLSAATNDEARWASVLEIERLVGGESRRPVLLCGDFNAEPSSRVAQRLSRGLSDVWAIAGSGEGFTSPAGRPRRRIDYIWYSEGRGLVPTRAWVPESVASDHRPVVAEFGWSEVSHPP